MKECIADMHSVPWDVGAVGTCGQIQPCNDIRLMDVPDMGVSILSSRAFAASNSCWKRNRSMQVT